VSFVRFGVDGSNVYLFDHADYGPVCWNCSMRLDQDREFFSTDDLDTMLAHIAEHRASGDTVPEWVDQVLRDEWEVDA
jgi:hypothetical protein